MYFSVAVLMRRLYQMENRRASRLNILRKGGGGVKDVIDADRLEELAKPLIEYLMENCHPHSAIVITAERTAVIETVLSIPQDEIC